MDIDTDFSFLARNFAVSYATKTYGAKAVAGIMTKTKLGGKSALTYAPKLLAKEQGLDLKAYAKEGAYLRGLIDDDNAPLSSIEEKVAQENETMQKIFSYAKMLEGMILSYGQHAAGTIVIMDGAIEDYIPLMMTKDREGNDKLVIQADMTAAEAQLGFIKFDFLGLKNLNVITRAQKLITERYNKTIDTYHLPLDDKAVYEHIFQTENTNFVFQFESDGMKKLLRDLHPTCFNDLILAVSVYRPGPMDFIPDILDSKNNGTLSKITERVPILRDVLKETYGYPVYQEQVMKIMTTCAGFSMGMADNVRRFMSKKKEDKLAAVRPEFISGCKKNGISADTANWLFDQLMPFAKYGFNKSHAAAYSLVSYITAWLKEHYPKEYFCAAMLEQGDKTMQLRFDCARQKIDVLPPDVNESEVDWSVEGDHAIRAGLSAIKGLKDGAKEIVKQRGTKPFGSIEDFLTRTSSLKSNEIEMVILSGACDGLVKNRVRANEAAKKYIELLRKEESTRSKAESEKRTKELSKIDSEKQECLIIMHDETDTPKSVKRSLEMTYLSMFFSGSPLEEIDVSKYQSISDCKDFDSIKTIGIVTKLRTFLTKNGDKMAVFTLVDMNSVETPVVVFPSALEKASLSENAVSVVIGKVGKREDERQIIADSVTTEQKESGTIFFSVDSFDEWNDLYEKLLTYKTTNGFTLSMTIAGQVHRANFTVEEEVVDLLKDRGILYRMI